MKKVVLFLMVLAVLTPCFTCINVSAESELNVSVTCPSELVCGKVYELTFSLDSLPAVSDSLGITRLSFKLNYDPTVVSVLNLKGQGITADSKSYAEGFEDTVYADKGTLEAHFINWDAVQSGENVSTLKTGKILTVKFEIISEKAKEVSFELNEVKYSTGKRVDIKLDGNGNGCKAKIGSPSYIKGDYDGNGVADSDDAIFLLMYVMFDGKTELNQSPDFNGDGSADSDDAIDVLFYVMFS